MSFPNTVDDLIASLDAKFPEPAIGPNDTMDKIKFDAGARSVINYLKTWRAQSLKGSAPPPKRGEGRNVHR